MRVGAEDRDGLRVCKLAEARLDEPRLGSLGRLEAYRTRAIGFAQRIKRP